jgi:CO dehydrogenase nickel-insertion accessory protein CooC1
MKVAVSGKGGVGKTLIAGGLARGFVERWLVPKICYFFIRF